MHNTVDNLRYNYGFLKYTSIAIIVKKQVSRDPKEYNDFDNCNETRNVSGYNKSIVIL